MLSARPRAGPLLNSDPFGARELTGWTGRFSLSLQGDDRPRPGPALAVTHRPTAACRGRHYGRAIQHLIELVSRHDRNGAVRRQCHYLARRRRLSRHFGPHGQPARAGNSPRQPGSGPLRFPEIPESVIAGPTVAEDHQMTENSGKTRFWAFWPIPPFLQIKLRPINYLGQHFDRKATEPRVTSWWHFSPVLVRFWHSGRAGSARGLDEFGRVKPGRTAASPDRLDSGRAPDTLSSNGR
jgi:hypothetical protein